MGTASSGGIQILGGVPLFQEQIMEMVLLLASVGLTDGIESSLGVGLSDGVVCWFWSLIECISVGSHWSVLHTFEERLRVDNEVSLSVFLSVGYTSGACVGILASRLEWQFPFALC